MTTLSHHQKNYVCVQKVHTHRASWFVHSESILIGIPTAGSGNPGPSSLRRNISEPASNSSSNRYENTYHIDTSKPVGDACREDGTLKDASEMEWPNSPTELTWHGPNSPTELEWPNSPTEDQSSRSESEPDEAPKAKVSIIIGSWDTYWHPVASRWIVDRSSLLTMKPTNRCQNPQQPKRQRKVGRVLRKRILAATMIQTTTEMKAHQKRRLTHPR